MSAVLNVANGGEVFLYTVRAFKDCMIEFERLRVGEESLADRAIETTNDREVLLSPIQVMILQRLVPGREHVGSRLAKDVVDEGDEVTPSLFPLSFRHRILQVQPGIHFWYEYLKTRRRTAPGDGLGRAGRGKAGEHRKGEDGQRDVAAVLESIAESGWDRGHGVG